MAPGLVLARDKGKIEMACGGHEERSSILQRLSVSHHREAQQSSTNVHIFSPGTKDCDDGRVHAFPLQQLLCGGTHVPVPATSANLPPPRVETGQGNWQIVGSLRQFAIFCGLLASLSPSLSPFTSTLAGSQAQITRPGILLAPRQHDVAVPPCRAYARIVKGRARVVGVWSLDLWFGRRFASKPACACACLGA
jgi:hypothetical protein